MAKFHVLKYNQWIMNKFGIYSYRLTEPSNEFFKSIRSYYILFTIFVINFIPCAVYVYLHWPNFEVIFETMLCACGNIQTLGMFFNIGLQMKKIKVLHLKLQKMVDEEGI